MDKNKATPTEIAILVLCIFAFVASMYVQSVYTARDTHWAGIVSQIEVLASIFMVTSNRKRGFISACILNALAGGTALMGFVMAHNILAMPGVLTALITIIMVTIVYLDKNNLASAHEKLNHSFEELVEKNHQIQNAEAQLRELAYSDALTGMNNRAWMREQMADKIQEGTHFAFVIMDMDNFKQINDTFGHQMGDTLIKTYATRFQKYCGVKYPCAKIGGDEFAMMIEGDVTQADVLNLIEQLRNLFGEVVNVNGQQFRITMSYGIAGCPNDGTSPDSIINAGDTALYNAKLQGKDRPVVYSPQSLG